MTLYYSEVETTELYMLKGQKANKLLKQYPDWNKLEAGNLKLHEVGEYFRKHGTLLGNAEKNNIFIGFEA